MWIVFLVLISNIASAAIVETIDAQSYEGEITRLDDQGLSIQTSDGLKKLPVDDLSNVILNAAADPPDLLKTPGRAVVLTLDGDILSARNLRVDKDHLQFQVGNNKTAADLPLGLIQTILLPSPSQTPEEIPRMCEEIHCTGGVNDVLVIVGKNGTPRKVTGTLVGVTDTKITFTYRGKQRTANLDRVRAILPARPGPADRPPRTRGRLVTDDGCVHAFSGISLFGNQLVLRQRREQTVEFPKETAAKILFQSDRLTPLAALKPSSVREHGMFDQAIPYRVNRSAGGGPLRLAGRKYDTGLGMHSFCELTYDLGGKYRALIATAGIDDAVRPNGAATLTILADGKPILPATTLRGKDKPKPIRLDITGVKSLTIRVDFGPDKLDVSDHVNLVNIRLVK
ncbi:MAG: NPCBM/NEW2 domain-containing protein [Phycisphaerae bacterium]|nr:NPCBM/NEW2 domain-containing protein [Phycisphaerae bacterium]